MADHILLVCTANQCRSPYAAAVLQSVLREAGAQRVALASAGTDVTAGLPMCRAAAERLPDLEATSAHRARALTVGDVATADLILVAERGHRAAIVRMTPTASTRTFTILEAAALAGAARSHEISIASGPSVAAFAASLHEARGLTEPLELDIADGHHGNGRRHRRTLDRVEFAATAVANALLGREPPPTARVGSPRW